MNRREFFRRTIPAVAVTVASVQSGWATDFFRRVLGRVLRKTQELADYNTWAPGILELCTSTSLHGLSSTTYTEWRCAWV